MSIASAHENPIFGDMPPKKRTTPGAKQAPSTRSPKYVGRGEVPDNPFARLIERRRQELNLTWYDIARLGDFKSHTIVYALAKKVEWKQPPRQDTLKRISKALSLPLDVVKAAAAEACGYQLEEISVPLDAAEDVKIVVAAMTELSDADREELRRRAVAFAAEVRADRLRKATGG